MDYYPVDDNQSQTEKELWLLAAAAAALKNIKLQLNKIALQDEKGILFNREQIVAKYYNEGKTDFTNVSERNMDQLQDLLLWNLIEIRITHFDKFYLPFQKMVPLYDAIKGNLSLDTVHTKLNEELKKRFNDGDKYFIELANFEDNILPKQYDILIGDIQNKETAYLADLEKAYEKITMYFFKVQKKSVIETSGLKKIRYIIEREKKFEETTFYDAFLNTPIDVDKLIVVDEKDLEARNVIILADAISESLSIENRIEKSQFMKQKPVVGNYRLTLTVDKKKYIYNHVSASIPFIKYGRVIIVTIPVSRAVYLDEPTGSLTLELFSSFGDLGVNTLRYRLEGSGERILNFEGGVKLFIRTMGARTAIETIVLQLNNWKVDKIRSTPPTKVIIREDPVDNNNKPVGVGGDKTAVDSPKDDTGSSTKEQLEVDTNPKEKDGDSNDSNGLDSDSSSVEGVNKDEFGSEDFDSEKNESSEEEQSDVMDFFNPYSQHDLIGTKIVTPEEISEPGPSLAMTAEENISTIYTIEDNLAWPDF